MGVNAAAVENLRRLTPAVFRINKDEDWCVDDDVSFEPNETPMNCDHCLDVAIAVVLKKREYERARRWPSSGGKRYPLPDIYAGHTLYRSADTESGAIHTVKKGYIYAVEKIVSGFNPRETYYYVSGGEPPDDENPYGSNHVFGYLSKVDE